MDNIITQKKFYNAVALACQGSYAQLKKLHEASSNWQTAYESLPTSKQLDIEKAWEKLLKKNVSLVLREEEGFPDLLRHIPFSPFGLYYLGKPITTKPKIAMIGTRKATPVGLATAKRFAKELAVSGLEIVSGLALGIDAASHEGALEGNGVTLAVLANGLDIIYPRQNDRLHAKILEKGGAIISEYPLGETAQNYRFLERNRIVSGLSKGVIVIEAPKRSGTLATSRFAIEQNREVFVVPGLINNPNYEGSHTLIQSGAMLITCTQDILAALGIDSNTPAEKTAAINHSLLDKNQRLVLDILVNAANPLHTDEIISESKLSEQDTNETLAILTIGGIIKEDSGRYFIN